MPNQQPHHRHNQHPQLRLPLSHHGLPRAPKSPSSSFSSRSNRYEALSNPHSSASSTNTTPTLIPHGGPKHQHNPSITSSWSPSAQSNTTTADDSQRAASFFRYSRTGDAPPSPPMTPFSPSAFPSETSTPMVLSPALPPPPPPPQTAASDDSVSQCCARCPHCSGSVSEATVSQQQQQQRSRSVEDVPSPVRRHASTRSLKHAESTLSSEPPLVGASRQAKRPQTQTQSQSQSQSREGTNEAGRGRSIGARGPDGRGGSETDASTCVGVRGDEQKQDQRLAAGPLLASSSSQYVPPPSASSSSSSSFSRMGKRIKAALGGPKKGAAAAASAAAVAPSGVRNTGTDAAAERKMAKRRERERERERDALVEVEEVGGVHWTEM